MRAPAPRHALRRYPALGFLGMAAALALLLPSRLTTPRTGPSSLAEYAPVPGQSQGASDLAALGQGTSGGLGFGAGRGPAAAPSPSAFGGPPQRRPRVKRCVGSPPRQTEDPLSPPCVAFFEGDNGGATWRGVSSDEVTVVVFSVASPPGATVDCQGPFDPSEPDTDRYCRAYMRYFNDRYQTYKRTVHLYNFHSSTSRAETQARAEVAEVDARLRPFAVVSNIPGFVDPMADESGRRGIVMAGYTAYDRGLYLRHASYVMSFAPDWQDEAAILAGYACRKLAGRVARYSGNVEDRTRTRRFGFMYSDSAADRYRLLKAELSRACGIETVDTQMGSQAEDYATGVARLRAAGVTTVIPVGPNGQPILYTNTAQAQGWFPEWLIPGQPEGSGLDTNFQARLYNQAEWRNAFGVSFDYRRGRQTEQHWYLAFREACPDCVEPQNSGALLYDSLTMLFYGIQAAGPRLSPQNIDKGLHAIPPQASTSPYRPATYFAPGNYSYVKDAMEVWWDPAASAPDGRAGCYRLPNDGQRRRAWEWPEGDGGLFDGEPPCQGPS